MAIIIAYLYANRKGSVVRNFDILYTGGERITAGGSRAASGMKCHAMEVPPCLSPGEERGSGRMQVGMCDPLPQLSPL